MRTLALVIPIVLMLFHVSVSAEPAKKTVPAALDFTMNRLDGKPAELKQYQGRVVLVVNVASECGLTPQYASLEKLHVKYHGAGLSVLGFPANEFGGQEPGTNEQIAEFCRKNYGVSFDMFAKVVVEGEGICPLYEFLTSAKTNAKFAGPIKWNFEKFLIGRNGEVVARFDPDVEPDSEQVIVAIERELAAK